VSTPPPDETAVQTAQRRTFVKGQYENLWGNTHEKAVKLLERGETNLSRIHLLMRRDFGDEFSDPVLAQKGRDREAKRRETGFLYDRQLLRFVDVETRVSTLMLDAVKMRELANACGDGIGRVVELGSGWGKTLFNFWLHGGPRGAEYRGLELTEAGRKTGELIAERAAVGMDFKTRYFNYYEPDFSDFADDVPTVVFTHHSIEQMPQIGEGLFEKMLAIPGFRRCVHLEPVGFQMPGDDWLQSPDSSAKRAEIDSANRRFAEKKNQNMNLYPLLTELERRRSIRITRTRKYFCSTVLQNATSLIVWEPAPRAA